MLNIKILSLAALAGCAISAHATWYTSEASFLSAIGTSYTESFPGWTYGNPLGGTQTSWNAPGANGFGWTASATNGLWSNLGSLSTNNGNDPIDISFTGASVYAFGTRISNTDLNGNYLSGTSHLLLSNGEESSITLGATEGFLGWVGSTQITSGLAWTTGSAEYNWVQLDNVTVATQAVPEPASMAALGFGALALLRKRRRSA